MKITKRDTEQIIRDSYARGFRAGVVVVVGLVVVVLLLVSYGVI